MFIVVTSFSTLLSRWVLVQEFKLCIFMNFMLYNDFLRHRDKKIEKGKHKARRFSDVPKI